MARNTGTIKLQIINARGKVIQSQNSKLGWRDCISRAAKQLKSEGKI